MPSLRKSFDALVERRTAAIPTAALTPDERLALVGRHGDFSLAYSTAVQDDLFYFGGASGYLAFGRKMGSAVALADPVAAPAERADLVRRFVDKARDPCFVQIGEASARVLSDLGYKVNRMGIDTRLMLTPKTFAGSRNETVRYSERWLFKNGFSIVEDDGGGVHAAEIKQLSDAWRAQRIVSHREMRFLNRPFRSQLGKGMRRFMLLDPQKQPVAILDFDPMVENGELAGYTTSFKRKLPGITSHAEIGLTKFAADRLRDEGRKFITLGLSPLAGLAESGFPESRLMLSSMQRFYRSSWINRRIFNVEGQAAFKRRFHGDEEPVYIAFRRLSPFQMLAILRLSKAF
ncbi:phosphatidylglycerol lysyltransferase domain-containing protein [Mesorhizobium yinganensis]|uniref:phosphatidylglycerol lysyltransferase domain-containing protein n=1 Tax=Mesorhizobium yinganensis TaxID=3157707 RepID=UPI0032B74A31